VVLGIVVLCADSTSRFFLFTEFGVVAITLTVMAVGVRGLREVWCDAAFSVAESRCGCAKVFEVKHAQESNNKCGCLFADMAFYWDKPAQYLYEL
jgi:hypothetical protein